MIKIHETVVKEPGSESKGSRSESSTKPVKLHMDTKITLIKENSAKTGLTIRYSGQVYISLNLSYGHSISKI